mmetsp:Transcript_29157/g.67655  ORF Transcript_29157/g.67655 Transcript_29157/m.67655 type:complete len:234 (-) Transcript_29157:87-788(-)
MQHEPSCGPVCIPICQQPLQRRIGNRLCSCPEVCRIRQLRSFLPLSLLSKTASRKAQTRGHLHKTLAANSHAIEQVFPARRAEFTWSSAKLRPDLFRRDHTSGENVRRTDRLLRFLRGLLRHRRRIAHGGLKSGPGRQVGNPLHDLVCVVVEPREPLEHSADVVILLYPVHKMRCQGRAQSTHSWLRAELGRLRLFLPEAAPHAAAAAATAAGAVPGGQLPSEPLGMEQRPLR